MTQPVDYNEIIRLGAGGDLAGAWDALLALYDAVAQHPRPAPMIVRLAMQAVREALATCENARERLAKDARARLEAYRQTIVTVPRGTGERR